MLIGFDAKRIFYNKSGLGNYGRNILNSLQDYFPDNEYFLFSPRRKAPLYSIKNQNTKLVLPKNNFLWRSKFILKNQFFSNLNIFHGLSAELPFGISKTKVKSIVTIHDLIFEIFPELYKPFDRKIYRYKAKKSCEESKKIIAISNQTKNDLINILNIDEKKIEVVYQSCNEIFLKKSEDFELKNVKEKYNLPDSYILYVGTIEPRKNAFLIVKAIEKFRIDIPLVLIGKQTDYAKEIIEFISSKNLENKIKILNFVETEDLPAIYQKAAMFVYPSIYEGFGIPIIEAFFSGIPVITSDINIFREVAYDSAIFVETNNEENLAHEIIKVLQNKDYSDLYKSKGKKRSNFFKSEKIANDLISIYKNL